MRSLLIIVSGFFISVFIACNEDEDSMLKFPDYILAGQTDGTGIYYTDKGSIDTLTIEYPDKGDSVYIDINGDEVDDFQLMSEGFMSAGTQISNHKIIPLGNNEIVGHHNTHNVLLASSILQGDTINASMDWINEPGYLYGYSNNMYDGPRNWGIFGGPEGKFIGVKIFVNNKELYGWIRVKASDWKLILIDFSSTVGYP